MFATGKRYGFRRITRTGTARSDVPPRDLRDRSTPGPATVAEYERRGWHGRAGVESAGAVAESDYDGDETRYTTAAQDPSIYRTSPAEGFSPTSSSTTSYWTDGVVERSQSSSFGCTVSSRSPRRVTQAGPSQRAHARAGWDDWDESPGSEDFPPPSPSGDDFDLGDTDGDGGFVEAVSTLSKL